MKQPKTFDQTALEAVCKKWQTRLRLQDWDIKIQFKRAYDLGADKEGECAFVISQKIAVISILDPMDYNPAVSWEQNIEQTVVHELLHLHFAFFGAFEGLQEDTFEQAINCIAGALVP